MAGICGVFSKGDCVRDLYLGTFYLQHRAQDYCGLAVNSDKKLHIHTHRGLIRQQFPSEKLDTIKGQFGIGCVTSSRQPVSELTKTGGIILIFDGNIINYSDVKDKLISEGASFSGYKSPEEVLDTVLVLKTIAMEGGNFVAGIKKFTKLAKGDFAVIALNEKGIYAARGNGRKPLVLGQKEDGYAVSSESNSFENTGFKIIRDVEPGEIIFIDESGIQSLEKINLEPRKYGTFEWIYTAHPASIIDGHNVAEVRIKMGKALARRFPIDADVVSPVPNSGRCHAIGYAQQSKIPYAEVFVRYDYSDRSYTPGQQTKRDEEAKTKLIPIESQIKGKRIILVDDSIVRGTQMLNRVKTLKKLGATEVHAVIACPPLLCACKYGKTTRTDQDCIARRMNFEELKKALNLDSLNYATFKDIEEATGYSKEQLCLECWG
ncbi:MAG: amidophosphoribosyltransferase [archaeon]